MRLILRKLVTIGPAYILEKIWYLLRNYKFNLSIISVWVLIGLQLNITECFGWRIPNYNSSFGVHLSVNIFFLLEFIYFTIWIYIYIFYKVCSFVQRMLCITNIVLSTLKILKESCCCFCSLFDLYSLMLLWIFYPFSLQPLYSLLGVCCCCCIFSEILKS